MQGALGSEVLEDLDVNVGMPFAPNTSGTKDHMANETPCHPFSETSPNEDYGRGVHHDDLFTFPIREVTFGLKSVPLTMPSTIHSIAQSTCPHTCLRPPSGYRLVMERFDEKAVGCNGLCTAYTRLCRRMGFILVAPPFQSPISKKKKGFQFPENSVREMVELVPTYATAHQSPISSPRTNFWEKVADEPGKDPVARQSSSG